VRQHNRGVWKGLGVIQYHLELSTVAKLARDQFNDLKAPGSSECSIRQYFLTVGQYKRFYLLIMKDGEYWDSG
jgi:hypothetical protein